MCEPTRFVRRPRVAKSLRTRELLSHQLVDGFAVHRLSGELRHHGFHHAADLLRGGRARLGDRLGDGTLDVRWIDGWRQVVFENAYLGGLLVGEVLTAAVGELLDRVFPLLDERGSTFNRERNHER